MEARLDSEFGKGSLYEGILAVHHSCYYDYITMVTFVDDHDDIDSEASSDLFCVACNKLFRTAKA